MSTDAPAKFVPPPEVEAYNVTKRFGSFVALDSVSLKLTPGSFHALLGENGAGKSTLVKCIMGYNKPDGGSILVGGKETEINNPRDAQLLQIGMVYQHFTLVPNMTVAENFVLARLKMPSVVDWKFEFQQLDKFMESMPFRIDPKLHVRSLAAGQKQKVEILKQLYLNARVLFLDEPTSVLTPAEADEILTLVHQMTREQKLSVLLITHKFRQVMDFADAVTVLRRGKLTGKGLVKDLTPALMAEMMIGKQLIKQASTRKAQPVLSDRLKISDLSAMNEMGKRALKSVNLSVRSGEIVGVAGVSGNGQRELVEVLAGQRERSSGTVTVNGELYTARREQMFKHKFSCLPEEPLKNACVPEMSVCDNLALRTYDRPPQAIGRWLVNARAIHRSALQLIESYRIRTHAPTTAVGRLSGGNVQRTVLARELSSNVDLLIVANPCFGLDFAAVADIHSQIMEARNRGVAVLLVSEDLDELMELSDRVLVMFDGEFVYEAPIESADRAAIGEHMAGMHAAAVTAKINSSAPIGSVA